MSSKLWKSIGGAFTPPRRQDRGEERPLTTLIEAMASGVLLVDEDLRLVRSNSAARRMLDLAGDGINQPLAAQIRDPELLGLVERVAKGEADDESLTLRFPDRGRQFEVQISRAGHEVLLQLDDVTRLERLEAVRREFVANVSHELRTPLTSIQAAIETLCDAELDEAQVRHFYAVIQRQTGRMSELVEDLTDLSKIETGAIELEIGALPLDRVIAETVAHLLPLADRLDVQVVREIPDDFELRADRLRLEQMITNLAHNAIKFNKPGGKVTIRVERDDEIDRLVVEDDGIGIPSESRPRIFNRFYQVEQARSREIGGTGLGLAIVKHLMRLHGGQVRVDSVLGSGSRFTLAFPRDSD